MNKQPITEEMHLEKEYEIEEDCMWDREYMEYVATVYQCGCCHAKVEKTILSAGIAEVN